MNSIPDPKPTNPDDALIARADGRLAHAYDQIARADEQLARLTEQLAKLESDAVRPPSQGDAVHRASQGPGPQPSFERPALRAGIGLLLAGCIVGGAVVLQSSYGSGAKLVMARWAPRLVPATASAPEPPTAPALPAPSAVQVAAAEATLPQGTTLAQNAPQDVALTPAATVPDHTQLLQTMSSDLTNLEREIEQLKANQQQIASDNLKAIEQLKASQQEMTRLLATVSERIVPKPSSVSTQPAQPARKPDRVLHSPQARARLPIPREWMYEEW